MDRAKPVAKRKKKRITDWESGLPETPCGNGSRVSNTEEIRAWLPEVIDEYDNIFSIADIGCGDQNWIHRCLPDGIEYDGYDVKPLRQDVTTFDVTREVLPWKYDLVLCIYVLNHMPSDMAERAIRLIKESGAKYLLMSYSNGDQYSLAGAGELVTHIKHKRTKRHRWYYGLWKL
jgi:hypothetical protein